jgi:hypothetical protein
MNAPTMTSQAAQLHASIEELARLADAAREANAREFDREYAAWLKLVGSDGLNEADVDAYADQRGETVVPKHAVDQQP